MSPTKQKKYSGQNHHGSENSSPYPVSRLAPATSLVDLAQAIAQADDTIRSHVNSKLSLIAKQIRSLQNEAQLILEQAERDQALHRADCHSQRIIGKTYFLYIKSDGRRYFSLLSPDDWHGNPPHTFLGCYRLENDMSWTELTEEE